jgi:hypothetical protein
VDGYGAVLLWNEYWYRNNGKALETLLAYNIQDTLSLHTLAVHAYNEKIKRTPFSNSHCLPSASLPPVPFTADPETVQRIRNQAFGGWQELTINGNGRELDTRNAYMLAARDTRSETPPCR